MKYAQTALDLNGENSKAHYRLAKALHAAKDYDKAKKSFLSAIKLSPGDSFLRNEYSFI